MTLIANLIFCALFVCELLITDVLCADTAWSSSYQPPSNNNLNAWPRLHNQAHHQVSSVWLNAGPESSTTPWPELGHGGRNHNPPLRVQSGPATMSTNRSAAPEQSSKPKRQKQNGDVQDDELREFSESLLQRDVNNAAKFVTVNYQGKTTSRSQTDEAPEPLLTIHPDAYNIPTIAKLLALHNNYVLETNVNEHVSAQERAEENNLLDALLSTSIMQHTRNFLIDKGRIGRDPREFRDILKDIWFNMYSRGGGKIGSSGFEHIFLAEIKNRTVSGLHNWLYFKEEEAQNRANYLGYMRKIELGNKGAILKFHFKFHELTKPVGSMFIGTSPELDIALYSTCFLLRADRVCPLKLAGHKFIIRTYAYKYRGKNLIGSAFPEI